jgi:hypothetical protein
MDWVTYYQMVYPHMVQIPCGTWYVPQIQDWLQQHVGERGHAWEFPKLNTYMFKDPDHAVQFALTFS